ncbi:MAG: WD40/YVTN/BNR-like repeat-containing protein, partial [Saprospiraceae bacterium]
MILSKKLLLLSAVIIAANTLSAQPWMSSLHENEKPNFFQIQQDFREYWKDKDYKEKGKGFKPFKRWEWFWESRVNEDGTFPDRAVILNGMAEYNQLAQQTQGRGAAVANWTSLGPNSSTGGYAGIGRINCIAFHPSDANTFWVGSPGGGLWKTTNGGTSWTTNTGNLPVLGVSGIVVLPSNPNIMYIATGDGDAWDTYSVGVMKSTDGGNTWQTTGLDWTASYNKVIRKLLMDPNDENHLIAATSNGLYRTTNAGVS